MVYYKLLKLKYLVILMKRKMAGYTIKSTIKKKIKIKSTDVSINESCQSCVIVRAQFGLACKWRRNSCLSCLRFEIFLLQWSKLLRSLVNINICGIKSDSFFYK